MNTHLRTIVAAALLAALVPAQTTDGAAALARAKVIEEQEGDLKAAESAYRALLGDAAASAVHGEAALRLGAMLWRLDKKDDGKPFLERAVAAGGDVAAQATAVLQGQGEAGKQAQERLEKARALVQRIGDLASKPGSTAPDAAAMLALRDLKWLGEAAVQAQVERLGNWLGLEDAQLRNDKGEPVPDVALFVSTLWEMGTEPAQQFFARSATEGTVGWRRIVTACAIRVAPDLMPALVRFLHDPDPTGEVPRNLDRILGAVPVPTLVELTNDAHAGARAAGFTGLEDVWPNLPPAEQVRIVELIDAPLRRALRDAEARPAHAAWRLVSRFAIHGPRAARRIVLAEIARFPNGFGALVQRDNLDWPLDDAEMDLLLATCRTLGAPPSQPQAPSSNARSALLWLFSRHQPEWSARSVDAVLELLELGYGGDASTEPNWLASFFELVEPGQLERFVRALPQLARAKMAFQSLASRGLPPALFPALRDVAEAGLRAPPRNWEFFKKGRSGGPVPGQELGSLLWNVGRTGAPEAAPWLSEFADRAPGSDHEVARALLELARRNDGEPVRAGLRKLLVAPDAIAIRSELFAELARLGDEPSIALYPRAYALGLRGHSPEGWSDRRPQQSTATTNQQSPAARGIGFLGLKPTPRNQPADAWHAYSDAQLVQAWRTLLASDAHDGVWAEIRTMTDRVPVQVLPILAAELPALWARLPAEERSSAVHPVLSTFYRVTPDQVAAGTELRATIEALLRAQDEELASSTFRQLPAKVALAFGDEARALLRRVTSPGAFATWLQRAGLELRTKEWQLALRDTTISNRMTTLSVLPAPLDPTLQQDVEALLRDDPSEEVRVVAADTLARLLAMDSVTPLLEALRDPSAKVRDAAKATLERFRFQRELQAFWANAKAGIDTSPSSAAAKLLAQAKPGEAKDQRLLAIRSLAALGAPESLPYLIEWTKDADAEIAAAARGAVGKIHETAGAKK